MRITDYDQALSLFDLSKLKSKGLGDLQLDADGNIAQARDGDWQMGPQRVNALFRLVERWRVSQFTIDELFNAWRGAADERNAMQSQSNHTSLVLNPQQYWTNAESIAELGENSGILAGTIFVVLDNLVQRFRQDLGETTIAAYSAQQPFDAVIHAAAANFRHYDEWATSKVITPQQKRSIAAVCSYLSVPIEGANGAPGIRSNVCSTVLEKLSEDSATNLHRKLFDYAKATAHYHEF